MKKTTGEKKKIEAIKKPKTFPRGKQKRKT